MLVEGTFEIALFEALKILLVKTKVIRNMTPCRLTSDYRQFRYYCCLHLHNTICGIYFDLEMEAARSSVKWVTGQQSTLCVLQRIRVFTYKSVRITRTVIWVKENSNNRARVFNTLQAQEVVVVVVVVVAVAAAAYPCCHSFYAAHVISHPSLPYTYPHSHRHTFHTI